MPNIRHVLPHRRPTIVALAALVLLASACTAGDTAATTEPDQDAESTTAPELTDTGDSDTATDTDTDTDTDDGDTDTDDGPQDVEEYLDELEASGFEGVVAIKQGEEVTVRGMGTVGRDSERLVDAATVYDIGSITKQFTAAAILRLEMDGLLSVEDSLSDHLDDLSPDKAGITLHQLLTHSAGFDGGFGSDYEPIGRDDYVALADESALLAEPGEQYYYSNAGYSLLGAIIERVSGQSYEAYLRDVLFEPAGMANTGYVLPEWEPQTIAVGYQGDTTFGRPNDQVWDDDGPYWHLRANGGLLSTAEDMLRWHEALVGNDILDDAAKEKLYGQHVSEGGGSYYGYGWTVWPLANETLIRHDGGNGIFFADFLRFLDSDLIIFVATNATDDNNDFAIGGELAGIVLGPEISDELGESDAGGFCGAEQDPTSAPTIDDFPATAAGETARGYAEVLQGGDDDAIRGFINDHAPEEILAEASIDPFVEEFRSDQLLVEGKELVGIHELDPRTYHLVFESPDESETNAFTIAVEAPDSPIVACIDIS